MKESPWGAFTENKRKPLLKQRKLEKAQVGRV